MRQNRDDDDKQQREPTRYFDYPPYKTLWPEVKRKYYEQRKNETYLKTYLKDPRNYKAEKREIDDSDDDILIYDNDDNYYIAIKKNKKGVGLSG